MPGKASFPIVGIGASAGGLEALQAFFGAAPTDAGLAYVVVTHLAPGQESALPSILGRGTAMPVEAAHDGAELEPNRVYVMASAAILTVNGRRLQIRELEGAKPGHHPMRHPIDGFLASLATEVGENAIGIILSGSGTDGSLGIKAIKEAGGLTLAQGTNSSAPQQPGMPTSAIATGLVDLVVPVEQMAEKMVAALRGIDAVERLQGEDGAGGSDRVAGAIGAICEVVRQQIGHDFSGYKTKTFLRRVERRMSVLQIRELDAYVERLRQDSAEVGLLFRDLLISVTAFFRDPDAFAALEENFIPRLIEGKGPNDAIRVWVPGCATGEEVYSLAILLREALDGVEVPPQVQIMAADIDERALRVARGGRYPPAMLEAVTPERLKRFFIDENGSYVVRKELRELCMFACHSLVRDPPFSRIDLVSCRNLLIYFGAELQRRIIPVFHYSLRPGGYLFLGISESLNHHDGLFAAIDKKQRVFQRRDHVSPTIDLSMFGTAMRGHRTANGERRPPQQEDTPRLRQMVERQVMERFVPAHVVVNREGDIVYYSQRTGRFLEAAAGMPSRQLLGMARQGLRPDLRTALREAAESREPVTRDNLTIEIDGRLQPMTLTVEPLDEVADAPFFLVVFAERQWQPGAEEEAARTRDRGAVKAEAEARELVETRDRLQLTVEEYETALEELRSGNEELVSVNEELQSTNEEFETSKEELQSVNEELQTVNLELTTKVEELDQTNADLRNLFESTRIPTIFLDRHAVIRSFTPAVSSIFNLIPGDRGRPLSDIAGHLADVDLRRDLQTVLDTREPLERAVHRHGDGAHYLMRILPYRTAEGEIDGVIVTFVDVTQIVEAEEQQRLLVAELNHRVRNMLQVVTSIASQTLKRATSPEVFADSFMSRLHGLGQAYELLSRESWSDVALRELVCRQVEPYAGGDGRLVGLEGPRVLLKAKAALAFGMVLHELATNAAKYGSLSAPAGRVEVVWSTAAGSEDETADRLTLRWRELGGPPAQVPSRRGFGSELIERQLRYEFGGKVDFDFAADGLVAILTLPLDTNLLVARERERAVAAK